MKMVRQWRYILLAALAIVALAVLAACSSSDDSTSTPTNKASGTPAASGPPADAAPDAQQLMTINIHAEPTTIDPQTQSYTGEATVVLNTFLTLFDQDPTTSHLTPNAAAAVPTTANGGVSADGLTYTIKLKPGLKWSDGTAVTAADFVYGIIRGYNLTLGGGYGGFITCIKGAAEALALDTKSATYLADVNAKLKDSVVAVDATTLKLVAAQPSVSCLSNFILAVTAAVKQSNVEALGDSFGQAAGAAQMVTDGPFNIKEWVPKDHITLVRSDTYTATPKALLKELKLAFITDRNQAYNALQTGQVDETEVPASSYAGVKTDPNVHQEQEFGNRWIQLDVTIPPWNNKDFVIAMNQATDRATLGRDVYFGLRQPWAAPCAAAVLDCDPTLFSNLEFNLTNAKASALKAYPDGNIPAITLETTADPTNQSLVQTLQSEWQQITGVHVTLTTVDQKALQSDMKNHIAGTQITGWSMDFADATDLWSNFTTASVGGTNLGFYSRPAYDTLAAQQDGQSDPVARKATLKQLQQSLAADPPVINMFVALRTEQFSPKVKGIVSSPFDYEVIGDQFLENMYIGK
jgi:oligopeptide transport system substrate-binding protein